MSRPFGSVNKSGLNLTKLIRDMVTEDDAKEVMDKFRLLWRSDDPDVSFKAIKLFFERFTVAADKQADVAIEAVKVADKQQFDKLLKELINTNEPTTDVHTGNTD